jgi:DNA-binding transcriptional regulator PaaX
MAEHVALKKALGNSDWDLGSARYAGSDFVQRWSEKTHRTVSAEQPFSAELRLAHIYWANRIREADLSHFEVRWSK